MYSVMYLPVDRPWKDGCTYVDAAGQHYQWDADVYESEKVKERGKVADLFIVATEFNQMRIVGQPSDAARKWLKPGMQIKHFNVITTEHNIYHGNFNIVDKEGTGGYAPVVDVRCEVCGNLNSENKLEEVWREIASELRAGGNDMEEYIGDGMSETLKFAAAKAKMDRMLSRQS